MRNFQLTFKVVALDTVTGCVENSRDFKRVIVTNNKETAYRICNAMLGEEIDQNERLCMPVSVESTDKEPTVGYWDNNRTWNRVLEEMKLGRDDVIFTYGPKRQKIGFSCK